MDTSWGVEEMRTEFSMSLSAIADTQNSFAHESLQTLAYVPYRIHIQDRLLVCTRKFDKENDLVDWGDQKYGSDKLTNKQTL